MTEDAHVELIASMVEASGRVRHPGLPIDRFLSVDAYDYLDDDLDDLTTSLPLRLRRRRPVAVL